MHLLQYLFPAAILFSACNTAQKTIRNDAYASDGYQLVWADEFNGNGPPDSSKWRHEEGFVRNNEAQWYQPQNATCSGGILTIEARRESKANPAFKQGSSNWRQSRRKIEYTSSSINTRDRHQWQYGRFVMRGKIDARAGIWPAWWTLGVRGQWPSNGEIDIMEYYRGMLLANVATGTSTPYKAHWFTKTFSVDSLGGKAWADSFHIWRMDWDETAVALYVDDILLNRVLLDQLENKDGSGINPFKQPHYMLLNLAIGGDNGGDPSNTTFPSRFEVDYVRVYQKK
ncbi:glycoside hydrolase family 16 protein [Pseudocnuella soli]|uniref:glycoside hydrolase family 16 protein n=1 Tax=Pseudocnuella soli TaxID=2502779 RepID=UPI0010479DD2|nr:glycoside hydrolase family 16 protein [Pseudocnuella soli]